MKLSPLLILAIALTIISLGVAQKASIDGVISQMTLEEKVSQLMMVGFSGKSISAELRAEILAHPPCGIALMGYNVDTPTQVAQLCNTLQEIASQTKAQIPLFIATDQEGGPVNRLKNGFTKFPANNILSSIDSRKKAEELARKAGEVIAIELSAVGVNMNLAPVLDVYTGPQNDSIMQKRSFGNKPEVVSRLGVAYIQGLQGKGVIATAKHFPGHGGATQDSHFHLPTVNGTKDELQNVHLKPFKEAIQRADVSAIMTAHIVYPAYDKAVPATLSPKILTQLLRKEMNFQGVIITDDLKMEAIKQYFDIGLAAVMAIKAGADIVLPLATTPEQQHVYNALLEAAENGEISEERLNESVRRILNLKAKMNLFKRRYVKLENLRKLVGTKAHKDVAREIVYYAK
ncbi:MAG: beta-N-acetylhexosaminidase [Candidatus Poribacteria bacterium]